MSETQAAESAATEEAHAKRGPMATIAALGTILTVLSGGAGLFFMFAPGLKPEPPAPTRAARLAAVEFVPNMSMRQMLDRTDQPPAGLTREELARRVAFLRYRFETVGYKGKELWIKSSLIRPNGDQVDEQDPYAVVPEANEDHGTWFTWAWLPHDRDRYRLMVQIFEPKGIVPIDELQSEPFRGLP